MRRLGAGTPGRWGALAGAEHRTPGSLPPLGDPSPSTGIRASSCSSPEMRLPQVKGISSPGISSGLTYLPRGAGAAGVEQPRGLLQLLVPPRSGCLKVRLCPGNPSQAGQGRGWALGLGAPGTRRRGWQPGRPGPSLLWGGVGAGDPDACVHSCSGCLRLELQPSPDLPGRSRPAGAWSQISCSQGTQESGSPVLPPALPTCPPPRTTVHPTCPQQGENQGAGPQSGRPRRGDLNQPHQPKPLISWK